MFVKNLVAKIEYNQEIKKRNGFTMSVPVITASSTLIITKEEELKNEELVKKMRGFLKGKNWEAVQQLAPTMRSTDSFFTRFFLETVSEKNGAEVLFVASLAPDLTVCFNKRVKGLENISEKIQQEKKELCNDIVKHSRGAALKQLFKQEDCRLVNEMLPDNETYIEDNHTYIGVSILIGEYLIQLSNTSNKQQQDPLDNPLDKATAWTACIQEPKLRQHGEKKITKAKQSSEMFMRQPKKPESTPPSLGSANITASSNTLNAVGIEESIEMQIQSLEKEQASIADQNAAVAKEIFTFLRKESRFNQLEKLKEMRELVASKHFAIIQSAFTKLIEDCSSARDSYSEENCFILISLASDFDVCFEKQVELLEKRVRVEGLFHSHVLEWPPEFALNELKMRGLKGKTDSAFAYIAIRVLTIWMSQWPEKIRDLQDYYQKWNLHIKDERLRKRLNDHNTVPVFSQKLSNYQTVVRYNLDCLLKDNKTREAFKAFLEMIKKENEYNPKLTGPLFEIITQQFNKNKRIEVKYKNCIYCAASWFYFATNQVEIAKLWTDLITYEPLRQRSKEEINIRSGVSLARFQKPKEPTVAKVFMNPYTGKEAKVVHVKGVQGTTKLQNKKEVAAKLPQATCLKT